MRSFQDHVLKPSTSIFTYGSLLYFPAWHMNRAFVLLPVLLSNHYPGNMVPAVSPVVKRNSLSSSPSAIKFGFHKRFDPVSLYSYSISHRFRRPVQRNVSYLVLYKFRHPDGIKSHISADIENMVSGSHHPADQVKFLPIDDIIVHDPHALERIIIQKDHTIVHKR